MHRALKWSLIAIGGFIGVLVVVAVIAYALFNAAALKAKVESTVASRTGRTLTIEGDLRLSVFPSLGVALGPTTLSEPKSKRPAAHVDAAKLSVALLPLLSQQIRVDRIVLDGLNATLIRKRDGSTNFDDLKGQDGAKPDAQKSPTAGGAAPQFDIAGIEITRSAITVKDAMTGTDVALTDLALKTGRLADGARTPIDASVHITGKQPALVGDLRLKATVQFELDAHRYAVESLDAAYKGTVGVRAIEAAITSAALKLAPDTSTYDVRDTKIMAKGVLDPNTKESFDVTLTAPQLALDPQTATAREIKAAFKLAGPDSIEGTFVADKIAGRASALTAQLSLDARGAQKKATGERTYSVAIKSPLAANFDTQSFDLTQMAGQIDVSDPALSSKKFAIALGGKIRAEIKAQKIAGQLDTRLDNAPMSVKFDVAGFDKSKINFDLDAQALDLDKLFPPSSSSAGGPAAASGRPTNAPQAADESPIDLSALKSLEVDGKAHIGQLVARGIKASDVRVGVAVHGGKARVAPMRMALYGGTAEGALAADAQGNRVSIAQKLNGVDVGALLRDAAKLDKLDGRGNLSLDVAGAGATVGAIKRSLAGSASVRIVDGTLKGFDFAKRLRTVRDSARSIDSLGSLSKAAPEAASTSPAERTDFTELSVSFAIANGVATSKDLDVKAPLLRLGGAGAIDIGHDRIDYTVQANLVNTLTGQGGKAASQSGGEIQVPVRVVGSLASPNYEVQWANVAGSLLQNLLRSRGGGLNIPGLLRQPQPQPSTPGADPKAAPQTDPAKALRDQLKGLLGR